MCDRLPRPLLRWSQQARVALPSPPGSSAVSSRKDGLSSGSGTQTCGGSRTSGCGQVPAALPSPPQSFAVRTHRGGRGS